MSGRFLNTKVADKETKRRGASHFDGSAGVGEGDRQGAPSGVTAPVLDVQPAVVGIHPNFVEKFRCRNLFSALELNGRRMMQAVKSRSR
jgi:hypothetical protein